jgi:hypothetical protein
MELMFKQAIWIALTVSLLGVVSASGVRADDLDKKTVLTFSQPVEIPGVVLPAGTYTFKLANAWDRHVVQVFNADGSKIIATVMTIPDYRVTATDETVIRFSEAPSGSPEAIRAWFYPGNTVGESFIYSKRRATQLARASKTAVPATVVDTSDADALRTASIFAVTPDEREIPLASAIHTTEYANDSSQVVVAATSGVQETDRSATSGIQETRRPATSGVQETRRSARANTRQLPKTASPLPLIVLCGLGSIALAFGLMAFGKARGSAV